MAPLDARPLRAAVVALALVPPQDPVREFGRAFTAAVRQGAAATNAAQQAAARDALGTAGALIPALPAGRRGRARFFVDVRGAELELRAGDPAAARRTALAARTRARAAPDEDGQPVYRGTYRVLLLVVLWQSGLPEHRLLALLEDEGEADFLLQDDVAAEVTARLPSQRVPYELLCGEVLSGRGRDEEAFARLQRLAEVVVGDEATPVAWRDETLLRLAWYFAERADYDRAEIYLERVQSDRGCAPRAMIALRRGDAATALREGRALAERDARQATLVGEALELLGRYEEALAEHLRSEQAYAEAGEELDRALPLNSAGDCLVELGDLDRAERYYRDGLALLSAGDAKHVEAERANALRDLGRLHERRGEQAQAAARYAEALDVLEEGRRDIPLDLLGSAWLRTNWGHELTSIDGLLRTGAAPLDALAAIERGKARGLLDWIDRPPVAAAQVARVRAAVQSLAVATDAEELAERRRRLERARALSQRAGLRSSRALTAVELGDVLRAEPDTLVLSYWVGAETAWLVWARGADVRLEALGPRAAAIGALGRAFAAVTSGAKAARGADPTEDLAAAAQVLLPASVRAALRDAARLVFSPDPILSRLPLEALPCEGAPLGTWCVVEWAPSLSVRNALARRSGDGRGALVVHDVHAGADLERDLGVDELGHSTIEAEGVAAPYLGAVPVRRVHGAEATLETIRSELVRAPVDVLHVNAHAIASPYVPSQSLLLLASGPEAMASLLTLPLHGAVVVLSACRSAGGEERGGEGVAGLLWGPMGAGARCVVASLWPANQESTAALMARFHRHRAEGRGEAQALQLARAELAAIPRYAHPYYWAGFAAFGSRDANPVLRAPVSTFTWPWWGGGAVAGGVLLALVWVGSSLRRSASPVSCS
ncbi:MAG: CHAT domain-containing tetratricopeptide repeat protein [Planctomycetota bacterium]